MKDYSIFLTVIALFLALSCAREEKTNQADKEGAISGEVTLDIHDLNLLS